MKTPYEIQEKAQLLGIEHLKKKQTQAIAALLSEQDVLLTAPTSFGKSAVAQIAGLVKNQFSDAGPGSKATGAAHTGCISGAQQSREA